MLEEKINIVSEIFKAHRNIIFCEANKFIAKGNFKSLQDECAVRGIATEQNGDALLIKIKPFIEVTLICFHEIERYFESYFTDETFAIFNSNGDYCFKKSDASNLVINTNATDEFAITCINIFYYYKLYNFLKSEEFADHHNDANSEIVIYSSAKGIFKIKYTTIPLIQKTEDISERVLKLIELATPLTLRIFFKNALFVFTNGTGIISINEIIAKATDIIDATKRDFELVSKQFDFEKFKDSLYKEKEKYFTNLRDIINKIFSQAIGIPISISATVFATYKVGDDSLMLLLVWFSFILYVTFYVKIQSIYKADVKELRKDFANDFEIIKSKSGLPPDTVQSEKQKIEKKIFSSITMIDLLIYIIVCLGILVTWYIFYEIIKSESSKFLKCLINKFM